MVSEDQHQIFTIVSASFNSLSFISCVWLFCLYSKSSSPRTVQFKMLVCLTLSDFLIAITGFLTQFSPKNDRTCSLNIFLSLVGFWSSAFWSAIVAIFSYKKTASRHEFNSNSFFKRAIILWLLICVGIPLL